MYIHVHVYTYTCTCTCTCVYMYTFICTSLTHLSLILNVLAMMFSWVQTRACATYI